MKKRMLLTALVLCLLLTLLPTSALAGNGNTEFPQRCTAYMKIKFRCGCKTTGTGGLIAADGLLTAGHNLICREHNALVTSIEFYFGYISSDNYWYRYKGKYTPIPFCDFSKGYTAENDIGLVKFAEKIGLKIGWYGSQTRRASEYEREKGFICYHSSDGKGLICKGTIREGNYRDAISIDHAELPAGADGAPIYFLRGAGLNEALIAVYTHSENGKCYGTVINRDVFDTMQQKLSFE